MQNFQNQIARNLPVVFEILLFYSIYIALSGRIAGQGIVYSATDTFWLKTITAHWINGILKTIRIYSHLSD